MVNSNRSEKESVFSLGKEQEDAVFKPLFGKKKDAEKQSGGWSRS